MIPSEIGHLMHLKLWLMHENEFSGPLPSEIGALSKLEEFSLGDNQLSGIVPSEIQKLSNLEFLNLINLPLLYGNLTLFCEGIIPSDPQFWIHSTPDLLCPCCLND
mmetsp:Transcript_31156/g.44216  ORF Transcript_31156/g.44216 Transcript_31156/m.44216 type:complete len:106 (+) Transcript_31156:1460-1777(+)